MGGEIVRLSTSSPRRKPGPITTNGCGRGCWSYSLLQYYSLGLWVPAFAGTTRSIIALRRRDKAAVVRRADQDLVDADPRRQARDKGDGAAAILGLQHPGLLGFARRHRSRFQDRRGHLARRQAAGAQAVDAFIHVEGMGQCQHRMLG